MKKRITAAITLLLACTVLATGAFAANSITTEADESAVGAGNTYKFSAETVGTEQYVYTEEGLNFDTWEREDIPHTVTAYLLPVGTEITSDYISREKNAHMFVDLNKPGKYLWSKWVEADHAWTVEYHDSFTIPDTKNYYFITTVYDYQPLMAQDKGFWVKGVDASTLPGQPAGSFTDVASTAYYADAVKWAVDKGITTGTTATTFAPDTTCTTGQILTFLWRAKGSPVPTAANPFTDVAESDYYYKAALWAAEKGLVEGATFGASTPCTRSATVTYLWKLAGEPTAAKEGGFADVPRGASYAKAVAWAVDKGITSGTSATTFAPDTTCTRGQIVTFLYRDMGK